MPASRRSTESAGLLAYRRGAGGIEVLLAHPGGPFWARRDLGAWSLPKGELEPGEDPLRAARREFREELGVEAEGRVVELGSVRQRGGKVVHAWAVEMDLDPWRLSPGSFRMEWPPGSGRLREFPEVDRVAWFSLAEARRRIVEGQRPLLDRLESRLEPGE